MTTQVSPNQQVHAKPAISSLAQNIAAFVFGVAVLFAIGFLPMEAAHNAAHDTRHTLAFPCH
jgi:cobalt transporter subunit CbtB